MMRAGDIQLAWTGLPIADIETICGQGRTLILAPHPDDESLGCGGLIAELCRAGRPPLVVVLTDGTGSHPALAGTGSLSLRRLRESEAANALCRLGLIDPDALVFVRLRDTAAPHEGPAFDAAVTRLAALAAPCETICAPWAHDPHCDHEAANLMACAVAARTGMRHLAYPVWGWALPQDARLPERQVQGWRLDIARSLPAKRSAIAAHRSQFGTLIHDDPGCFTLPDALLQACQRPYEVFLTA
jgi:LmbE family N-acetylglucosaminyl deacetylase